MTGVLIDSKIEILRGLLRPRESTRSPYREEYIPKLLNMSFIREQKILSNKLLFSSERDSEADIAYGAELSSLKRFIPTNRRGV